MARLEITENGLGLCTIDGGRWGMREHGPNSWQVQRRENPGDPWGWEIVDIVHGDRSAAQRQMLTLKLREASR